MSERATLNQVVQIGIEEIPGTAVAATRRLPALSITPRIQASVNSFRPVGGKFATIAALGKEWIEASIEGAACYNHIVYLLNSILTADEPVQQGVTTAYKWEFVPAQNAADAPVTFTVEHGSAARAGKFAYGLVNSFTLDIDRESVTVGGSMIGQAYQDGITMTASGVKDVPVQPIQPTEIDVFLDSLSTDLGKTKLTRVLSMRVEVSDRYAPVWTLNSAVDGFAAHVESAPTATITMLMEADAAGMGLLAAMRAGAKRFLRLQATGPTIASTYTYSLTWDVCLQVREVGEFSDEDGVYGIEWTFDIAYDATWGKAMSVAVVNKVSDEE